MIWGENPLFSETSTCFSRSLDVERNVTRPTSYHSWLLWCGGSWWVLEKKCHLRFGSQKIWQLGTAQVTHAESTEHQKILRSPGRWITDVRIFSSQYCWWHPEIWRFQTSWGNGSLPPIIYRVSKTSILGGCSFYHPKNTWSWKTPKKRG